MMNYLLYNPDTNEKIISGTAKEVYDHILSLSAETLKNTTVWRITESTDKKIGTTGLFTAKVENGTIKTEDNE